MNAAAEPQGQAMYVVSRDDRLWLLNVQRKLYARSREQPDYVFEKLWGLVTEPRNLRIAFARVNRNRGRRTAGIDRVTAQRVLCSGVETFLQQIREDLRAGEFRPSPVRRVLIPKAGKPGRFRPLGIPTVKDRVVQAAVKNILEPIFEADFYPCSYGFRPGKSVHGALEHLKSLLLPRWKGRDRKTKISPYQWAIEGDIKGCFDNIDHHGLMTRVRKRVKDTKVNRLVVAFLKAGVLSEEQFTRTREGTPQGGILSPLLANIALSVVEERYARYVWPKSSPTPLTNSDEIEARAIRMRQYDRPTRPVFVPIRYADDFIILVSAPDGPEQQRHAEEAAHNEKAALAAVLKETLKLELSESKTLVTPVTKPMRFLGHHVRVRDHHLRGPQCALLVPKDRTHALREHLKRHFVRATTRETLAGRLRAINPKLRGWASFYRYAFGAKRLFTRIDHYVWWTIFRWLRKKHPNAPVRDLFKRYGWRKPARRAAYWQEGRFAAFRLGQLRTGAYRMMWQRPPDFAINVDGEPGA